MTDKLSNLGGLAAELDKLTAAIEADAKKRIERVAGLHAKRERVFAKVDARIDTRDVALDEADAAFDKLDQMLGDNGGPALPTSDGS